MAIFNRSIFNNAIFNTEIYGQSVRGRERGRRRRGIYHPRTEYIVDQIERNNVDQVAKENAQEIIAQAQQIAKARADFEIAKAMAKSGKERKERLARLELQIAQAEERMAMLHDEEDFIMLLAFAV